MYPGKGRGGMRREYIPTPEVMALIEALSRGEIFREPKHSAPSAAAHSVREPAAEYKLAPPDGFVLVPRYDVHGSMGNGSVIHSEQIVDHLAFRAEWVRTALGANPEHLVLISAIGDSMEPTLRAGDLLLIDRSVTGVKHDSIYAFAVGDELRVKRVQRLYDGTLIVKSDNPGYASETLTPEQSEKVVIVGRVVWTGHRM
ncbi:MAG: S24 family peptidase [Pseudomonadota bacterium]